MQTGRWALADKNISTVLRHVRFKRRDPADTDEERRNYLKRLERLLMKSGRPLFRRDGFA